MIRELAVPFQPASLAFKLVVNYDLGQRMADTSLQQTELSSPVTVESLNLKLGDDVIHYLKAGGGPPVLLLHGGACESSDWIETMVALSDRFTFYAPDLVGYGLSDRNKNGYVLADFVNSVVALTEALDISTADIVGHSLGGRIGVEIALHNPGKVRKLVLIDAAGFSRLALWGSFLATLAWAVRSVLRRPQPYPRFLREDGADPHWLCLGRISALDKDTLIIWNRHDPYYSVKGAYKAEKLMPNAELKVFPGYGHAPHRTQRELFNTLLLEFLSR